MQMEGMQKFLKIVNTGFIAFVLIMMGLFSYHGITFMVYLSIPIIAVHIVLYFFIQKKLLHIFTNRRKYNNKSKSYYRLFNL